jgi:hypothetical protein
MPTISPSITETRMKRRPVARSMSTLSPAARHAGPNHTQTIAPLSTADADEQPSTSVRVYLSAGRLSKPGGLSPDVQGKLAGCNNVPMTHSSGVILLAGTQRAAATVVVLSHLLARGGEDHDREEYEELLSAAV